MRFRNREKTSLDETVFIETYRLYGDTEIMPWLERISAPALVMTGEFARGCDGEAARRSAGQMKDARLVILEGLKNGLLTEAPARVASEIRTFVRSKAS